MKWTFQCPQGQAMVAFASGAFRRNNERDRRWRYQCGRVNGLRARNPSVYAAWTDWANDWDKERSGTWGVMRIYQALEKCPVQDFEDCSLQTVKLCVLSELASFHWWFSKLFTSWVTQSNFPIELPIHLPCSFSIPFSRAVMFQNFANPTC